MEIEFIVPGAAVPKGRPRFTKSGHVYSPTKTRDYEAMIAVLAKESMLGKEPTTDAVSVDIEVTVAVPKSFTKDNRSLALNRVLFPIKGFDLDNVVKSVSDGMNKIVFVDDKQVVKFSARKVYGEEPMVTIKVKEYFSDVI